MLNWIWAALLLIAFGLAMVGLNRRWLSGGRRLAMSAAGPVVVARGGRITDRREAARSTGWALGSTVDPPLKRTKR